MNNVSIMINYAGMQLQVTKNAQGQDITPLKPIADLFGLSWTDQYKKVTGSEFLTEHLGICIGLMPHASGQKREQTCILLSSVVYYLIGISPERVKANGNESGAQFLSEKVKEWTAALHDYEELGFAINSRHERMTNSRRRLMLSLLKERRGTADEFDRKLLGGTIKDVAAELGYAYQNETED